jgi:parvulin-like peptidyl-prolyl isomerase
MELLLKKWYSNIAHPIITTMLPILLKWVLASIVRIFESHVFALQKAGDISEPFETAYGYNILKLTERLPVNKDENDVVGKAKLQEKVEQDNRLTSSREALIQKWMQLTKIYTW